VPFAQANASGSLYELWLQDKDDLTGVPVVTFGDEGGQHVVARSLAVLLQIVGYDAEALVDHDEVSFYRDDDDYEPSAA
jgi:cell wall assembly regulator SMI1